MEELRQNLERIFAHFEEKPSGMIYTDAIYIQKAEFDDIMKEIAIVSTVDNKLSACQKFALYIIASAHVPF